MPPTYETFGPRLVPLSLQGGLAPSAVASERASSARSASGPQAGVRGRGSHPQTSSI
jgi:hypothetical protein